MENHCCMTALAQADLNDEPADQNNLEFWAKAVNKRSAMAFRNFQPTSANLQPTNNLQPTKPARVTGYAYKT